ncbi:resistin-like beta [Vombatus ursinus]|uniref:resistin-like beta n=1 Tax=Vombatus ursinus TaxID=29139 RepID=UPI000FFD2DE5|nr:resistin-like beta [Vombatus ursinus]
MEVSKGRAVVLQIPSWGTWRAETKLVPSGKSLTLLPGQATPNYMGVLGDKTICCFLLGTHTTANLGAGCHQADPQRSLKGTQPSKKMKLAFFFLLILITLLALMSPGHADCSLNSIVEKKVKEALSKLETGYQRSLSCISVKRNGKLAACPSGFKVTGCACGYGCGSWNVQGYETCHCQCSGMDWTTARCCKIS